MAKAKKLKKYLKYVAVITLCLLAILAYTVLRSRTSSAPEALNDNVVTYSTTTPSEEKPDPETYKWQGNANHPKKIAIPNLGIDAFIQKVGVDQDQKVAVPNNTHLAGWFVDSVIPGDTGLSIIDGHVDGQTGDGVFGRLAELEIDSEFGLAMGNGEIRGFRIFDKQIVTVEDSASVLFSQSPTVKQQLNLITCGGDFDTTSAQYNKRVIISAERIN